MCIDVVGTVLRVVFHDEDGCLWPELRAADRLDHEAKGAVVVAHMRDRRGFAGARSTGVIVGQTHDLQPRHLAFLLEAFQFSNEALRAFQVGIIHIETAVERVDMIEQRLGFGGSRIGWRLAVLHPFPVTAVSHTGFPVSYTHLTLPTSDL